MWLLLLAYVALALLFLFAKRSLAASSVPPPWPSVRVSASPTTTTPHAGADCRTHSDCPPEHACVQTATGGRKTCLPKLLRGGECDESRGKWVPWRDGPSVAACECLDHELFTQRVSGGDCDANVGCGTHGTYDPAGSGGCRCDPGYRAEGLACVRNKVFENMESSSSGCEEDEIEGAGESDGFHPDYLARLGRCVKRPCEFDALSGRPFRRGLAEFRKDWGCVCDPRYGLYGVVLEKGGAAAGGRYLKTEGFDACASVFVRDPPEPSTRVKLVTYFYLGETDPVSLVAFEGLKDGDLVPALRNGLGGGGGGGGGERTVVVAQSPWRYDYAQYFFATHPEFNARTRAIDVPLPSGPFFDLQVPHEHLWQKHFRPRDCFDLSLEWRFAKRRDRAAAYRALYSSPVCRVWERDRVADARFAGRVVVNPMHLIFPLHADLYRSNAFVLYYERHLDRWSLDLDYAHDVPKFAAIENNAPKYDWWS